MGQTLRNKNIVGQGWAQQNASQIVLILIIKKKKIMRSNRGRQPWHICAWRLSGRALREESALMSCIENKGSARTKLLVINQVNLIQ